MVKVRFKNSYDCGCSAKEYLYQDYEGAEVGDIVAVNTSNGLAIAKVTQIDVIDFDYDISKIKTVVKVIISKKELEEKQKQEYEKRLKIMQFLDEAKRKTFIEQLSTYTEDKETKDLFNKMTNAELERVYKALLQ